MGPLPRGAGPPPCLGTQLADLVLAWKAGLDADAAEPLAANSTDAEVGFGGGKAFSSLSGKAVKLELIVQDAIVYTVGFAT